MVNHIHGPGTDSVFASIKSGGTVIEVYAKDHLGSTTAFYRLGTSSTSGTVRQRYTYDEYGAVTVRDASGSPTGSTPETRYLFTGREYDATVGLYHYRHRWYHPELGRFVSPDPIGFEGRDVNIYGYCKSKPLLYRDPFGLWITLIDWGDAILSGGLLGAGSASAALGLEFGCYLKHGRPNTEEERRAMRNIAIAGVGGAVSGTIVSALVPVVPTAPVDAALAGVAMSPIGMACFVALGYFLGE